MREANICLLTALFAAVALAGCGSDNETTEVRTVTETATQQGQGSTTTTPPGGATTQSAATGAPAARHLTQFQSPSHNIGCYMSTQAGGSVRCDIRDHSWTAPPKPAYCDVDWGGGVQVGPRRPGSIVCAGDTTLDPGAPVLAYGQASKVGKILCASSEGGVRCASGKTGHGFFLARERYDLF